MNKLNSKARRLHKVEMLLANAPQGLLRTELAKALGVNKSTITRYVQQMGIESPLVQLDNGRLSIDRRLHEISVSLTMIEIEALHLASKVLMDQTEVAPPHLVSALDKLAKVQNQISTVLGSQLEATTKKLKKHSQKISQLEKCQLVIEDLTIAIAEQRPVHLTFESNSIKSESYAKSKSPVFPLMLKYAMHSDTTPNSRNEIELICSYIPAVMVDKIETLESPDIYSIQVNEIQGVQLLSSAPEIFQKISSALN
jgi:hypothetical protein